jgi:hypothetical protein
MKDINNKQTTDFDKQIEDLNGEKNKPLKPAYYGDSGKEPPSFKNIKNFPIPLLIFGFILLFITLFSIINSITGAENISQVLLIIIQQLVILIISILLIIIGIRGLLERKNKQ